MAEISAAVVKALRERTGAGMMDCKKALADAGGDPERAALVLRERGLAKAVKRAGRETSEGAVAIALAGEAGGIVELRCETDFVAKTPDFQALAGELARVAAARPGIDSAAALLDAEEKGEKVSERLAGAMTRIGENIVLHRVGRLAAPGGVVGGYVHAGGKLGVLVGVTGQGASEAALGLAKDLAMHVAAADPSPVAVDRAGVSADLVGREREVYRRQAEQEGKPAAVVEKIVEGRVRKFYGEVVLLEQPFVKDPDRTVGKLLEAAAGGGALAVSGFLRFKLGEASGA
ncbi:MAG TPA: translation elongation factor Ts [Myxococcota bacterium]|nr:translation elongation factor Ts [Myxococcota bacterium]